MFKKFALVIFSAVLGSFFSAHAAPDLSQPISIGPQVVVGKLPNGLTYYIQKNGRPQKKLDLRLIIKAGSVLEDEDQLGVAHIVEHMAFNGSNHFKKDELVSYMQSIGLKFGADLNASTSFDETVYLLPIPTDNPENIDKAFTVLEDWAHGISLNTEDIDKERLTVLEELRNRKGAGERLNKVLLPKIYGGSLYAKRLPIGTETSIKGVTYEAIQRFYKDWYRPNLMAVVIVGDIEVDVAKSLVKKHFSHLTNPQNERPRTYPPIPSFSKSEGVVITDKEAVQNAVTIQYQVGKRNEVRTLGDAKKHLVESLFGGMLGQRFQDLTQNANPPFIVGRSSLSPLNKDHRVYNSLAVIGHAGVDAAITALIQESSRARLHGFSEAELNRSKQNILRLLEKSYAERNSTESGRFAAEYQRNFLAAEHIPGIESELAYTKELLPTITPSDINEFAREVIPEKVAKLIAFLGVDKPGVVLPKEEDLLRTMEEAQKQSVDPRTEVALPSSLMKQLPTAGKVVDKRQKTEIGVHEWTLSNGITVVLKPTDFKADEILVSAQRFGGESLYPTADKFNANYASGIIGAMGLGEFKPTDVQKILAGKVLSVNMNIDVYAETLSASSSNSDLETMLQVVNLRFGDPRIDKNLFDSFITRSQDAARNSLAKPESLLGDTIRRITYQDHPRVKLTTRPEDFENIDLNRIRTIYRERMSSAKGMTFVFVGSFKPDAIQPLIERYIGSLPTADVRTSYEDMGIRAVSGVMKEKVYKGQEDKSIVTIGFYGTTDYSSSEQLKARALIDVLNIKFTEVLRQKLNLIYSGGMQGGLLRDPIGSFQFRMGFPCSPANADKVIAAAFEEIEKVKEAGPQPGDLAKVKKNWLIRYKTALKDNKYWLGRLQNAALRNTNLDPEESSHFEGKVEALTADDVKAVAQRYLKSDNYVQVVLYPEKMSK